MTSEIRQVYGEDAETAGGATSSQQTRIQYQLLGIDLGPECLAGVLGMGTKRFRKAVRGVPDMRFSQFGGSVRECPKSNSIDKFLFDLHGTVAETLPTEFLGIVSVNGFPVSRCFMRLPRISAHLCRFEPESVCAKVPRRQVPQKLQATGHSRTASRAQLEMQPWG